MENIRISKRGISDVVAVVTMILLVIVAVTIVWLVVLQNLTNDLGGSDVRHHLEIVTARGYTVSDTDTNITLIQVKQGPEETNIVKIRFLFIYDGETRHNETRDAPGINKVRTYEFFLAPFGGAPDSVQIAPIFIEGDQETEGSITDKVKPPFGTILDPPTPSCGIKCAMPVGLVSLFDFTSGGILDENGVNNGTAQVGGTFVPEGFEIISSGHVEYGTFDVSGTGITLLGWYKIDDISNLDLSPRRIISKSADNPTKDHAWLIGPYFNNGDLGYKFRLDTDDPADTEELKLFTDSISSDEWNFVAATYDGSVMRIFEGNESSGAITSSGSKTLTGAVVQDPTMQVWIGDSPPSASKDFEGTIGKVAVYGRALTPEEIDTVYILFSTT